MSREANSSDGAELGPPLCSSGASLEESYRCARRARLLSEEAFGPAQGADCALRRPCLLLIHDMPATWHSDPQGAVARRSVAQSSDGALRVVSHDWGSDEEPQEPSQRRF